jgi:hypothetical protein
MVLYYSVVLYSNLSVSKPVVDGMDVLGDDLECARACRNEQSINPNPEYLLNRQQREIS